MHLIGIWSAIQYDSGCLANSQQLTGNRFSLTHDMNMKWIINEKITSRSDAHIRTIKISERYYRRITKTVEETAMNKKNSLEFTHEVIH